MSNTQTPIVKSDISVVLAADIRLLENKRLMLVDDFPIAYQENLQVLKNEGADVTLDCDPLAAAKAVLAAPGEFDAVLVNLELSVLDCLEAASRLRLGGYDKPLVTLVPFRDEGVEGRLLQAGYNIILPKLAASEVIVGVIAAAIASPRSALPDPKAPRAF